MEEQKSKIAMSEELAMDEVRRWADANDIDITSTNSEGKKVLDAAVPKLARAVQSGRLVVNDSGDFEYTVSQRSAGLSGEKITFTAPTGAAYMSTDSFNEQQSVHKTLAMAAAMTGKDIGWFAKLHNSDYKVVGYIVSFFIAG